MTSFAAFSKELRLLLIIIVAACILAPSYLRYFDNYELELLDVRFSLRGQRPTTDEMALIEIGDDTVAKLEQWPLDRTYYAMMVKALSSAGARAILFDIFFSDATEHDDELEKALLESGRVYLPFVFDISARPADDRRLAAAPTPGGRRLGDRARAGGHGRRHK